MWLIASQLLILSLAWIMQWPLSLVLFVLVLSHLPFWISVLRPNSEFYGPVLSRLPIEDKRLWLTIDDGPCEQTPALLDLLDRYQAKATFFLVGERVQAYPEMVKAIMRRGHSIGNHTQTHPSAWFWSLGPRRMRRQIEDCQHALLMAGQQTPIWYRSVAGHSNPFVFPVLKDLQLTRVGWSARGYDAVKSDPAQIVAAIEKDVKPGAIVLLHEGSAHGRNLEIIEAVLQRLQQLGYTGITPETLVTPSQPPSARD